MTTRTTKPAPNPAATPAPQADERHQGDVDTFIARNREALNESIEISREEVARGIHSKRTVDDIIAAGVKRHSANG